VIEVEERVGELVIYLIDLQCPRGGEPRACSNGDCGISNWGEMSYRLGEEGRRKIEGGDGVFLI